MFMEKANSKVENVIIIGGGPAGLAAGVYTARGNLNPLVLAGSPPGGQLMLTSEVENYPGYDSILGPDLIEKYRNHAKKFGVRIIDENVVEVDFSKRPFTVFGSHDNRKPILTDAVIIATGAKAKWLGLPNEQRLRGHGVSACATCDAFFFRGRTVAAVGGGDTAMEDALSLAKFASKVYLIHRGDKFRASKIMQERILKHHQIEVIWNTVVLDVLGDQKVEAIKIQNVLDKSEKQLKVQGFFLAIGHTPDTVLFRDKVELDEKGYIITSLRFSLELAKLKTQNSKFKTTIQNSKLEEIRDKFDLNYNTATSIQGIFAAGDCADYIYRQAGTAVGMGIEAALDVERWLEIGV